MEFIDQYLNLAADLNDYLEGRIGDETILDRHFTDKMDPRLRAVKENIGQYIDDYDRRMEDDDWKPSRRVGAIAANEELIANKLKHHSEDRMGIIGFSGDAELHLTWLSM